MPLTSTGHLLAVVLHQTAMVEKDYFGNMRFSTLYFLIPRDLIYYMELILSPFVFTIFGPDNTDDSGVNIFFMISNRSCQRTAMTF